MGPRRGNCPCTQCFGCRRRSTVARQEPIPHPLHRQQPDRRQQPPRHRRMRSAAREGTVAVETTAVTASNFSLEDHWKQGEARAAIAKGGWSVVVLQQGPSALPESRVLLRDYTKRFAAEAQKAGARRRSTWCGRRRHGRATSTTSASRTRSRRKMSTALLLPAGDAWREAWRRDPSLALYGSDGFHPSGLGSYLAALAIWRALSRESVVGLPGPPGVSAGTLRQLQESADRAVDRQCFDAEGIRRPSMTERPSRPRPSTGRPRIPRARRRLDS